MYHSGNQMIDPHVLFQKAQMQPEMHVADLGCGLTGHIVMPGAKFLGSKGIMYAVDIIKDVLTVIHKRAAEHQLLNVHTVWSNIEHLGGTAIPKKSLDVAFLVNTLVQTKDRIAVLNEATRLIKDKARLVVVDWARKGLTFGPKDELFVNFEKIKEWAHDKDFVVQEEFSMGRFHKGIVLYRNK